MTYETTLAVNDPDSKFRPGMTANISIIVAHRDAVLLIPNVALHFRPPGSTSAKRERGPERTVYVLPGGNESTPEPVRIKTGISDGSLTEVTEGLKEGDGVVTGLASPQPAAQPAANANPGPATLSKPYAHRTKIIGNLVTTDAFQQDFTQTLPLNANGRLSLDNVNGRIEIVGWGRNEVAIKALKHGKTRESVEAAKINIDSSLDEIVIHTEQPSSVTGFPWSWLWFKNSKRNDGIVDYAIQVPQNARLKNISSVNGRIVIDGVAGDIEASTVNGEVQTRGAAGNLKLFTVNGRIEAELASLGGSQTVSLGTVNGQIEAILPAGADAEVSASTVNGGMSSEFPSLIVKKEFPLGRHLKGTLGSGGARIKASTVNGGISFRRGKDAQKSGAEQTEAEDAGQTVAGLPPVVVNTQPVSGARDVAPGVTEIRVRFSKEMADGSWSWSTAWENSAPEIIGQPHYESDGRTCVAKVKLEPGRTYAWWLNSDKFKNFTDLAGRPVVPYLLIFQTKPN